MFSFNPLLSFNHDLHSFSVNATAIFIFLTINSIKPSIKPSLKPFASDIVLALPTPDSFSVQVALPG